MTAELLRVRGLHAFYGESHILHGLDFDVNRAEVVTLLGRNGAGRTTTLRALLGLVGVLWPILNEMLRALISFLHSK